jgi:enterochelin esterase-like enzyme
LPDRRAKAESRLQLHPNLIVYLPPGYPERSRRYPALYLQDGQNLFDPSTAFAGQDWEADAAADQAIEQGAIQPLIIVGVHHAGLGRIEQYTEGERYLDRLVHEWKPFIDRTYRTARTTAVGGSSLGGLVALRAGLTYPRIFRKVAALSPSVWWDDRSIVRLVKGYRSKLRPDIWLDTGTEEDPASVPDLRILRDALLAKGWAHHLEYREVEGAGHDELAWRQRFGDVLRWMFPARCRSAVSENALALEPGSPGAAERTPTDSPE